MGNLFTKNSKVKGKTATQILPQIIWTNIIGRLTINDVFKSIRFVSKELKAAGDAVVKDKDRLAITVRGDTVMQCFDSSHFINEKDFLTLDRRFVSMFVENMDCLGRMMPSLKIFVFSNCISNCRNLAAVLMSSNTSFLNLVCVVSPRAFLWDHDLGDHLFPKIEHLVIDEGKHLDKMLPSLQSLNIDRSAHGEVDKFPDSCKRLTFRDTFSLNVPSLRVDNRLPRSLEVLDVGLVSFKGYQRLWRPSFQSLKDILIGHGIVYTESFIDFIRDHKRTLERFKLTLDSFSEEALKQILLEISDIKKIVITIKEPNIPDVVKKLKVLSTVLIGKAKNLFLEIDLDHSCGSVIYSCLENLPSSP